MMNGLKFNSQVCTTKIQSQRLLELGLKPETADMCHFCSTNDDIENPYTRMVVEDYIDIPLADNNKDVIPAWSLHRLLCMIPNVTDDIYWAFGMDNIHCWYNSPLDDHEDFEKGETIYDNIIDCVEWLISEGYFNKEYLKQCQTKGNTESI